MNEDSGDSDVDDNDLERSQAHDPANDTSSDNVSDAPAGRVEQIEFQQSVSGPLPPPRMLEHYKAVQTDLPERIITLSEAESTHRHNLENKIVDNEARNTRRGQLMGLVVALCAFVIAGLAVVYKQPVAAGIIGGTTVVGLVGVFVIGRWPTAKSVDERSDG